MFTLTPLERAIDGARVRFDCQACGHSEVFVRLHYVDVAHVLGSDHYWQECPAARHVGELHPQLQAHRRVLARRHRDVPAPV